MTGQDFTVEDHLDTVKFNAALWRGLKEGAPTRACSAIPDVNAGKASTS